MERDSVMSTIGEDQTSHERLEQSEIDSHSLLAVTHVHRYRYAAELVRGLRVVDLCCGTGYGTAILAETASAVVGVDIAPGAVERARGTHGSAAVEFTCNDALRYVEQLGPGDCDAIVCFEGIEHVPDPLALADALSRLGRSGTRLILSLPNSRGFEEDNPFHETNFGFEEAMELFARIGEPLIIQQRLAEGSILAPVVDGDDGENHRARVVDGDEDADPAWANHWLATYNVPRTDAIGASSLFRLVAVANQNRYMRALEQANADLYRINLKMGRERLGIHDAAAAAIIGRHQRRAEEAEARAADLEKRLAMEVEVAFRNDELFQSARRQLDLPQHRAAARLARIRGVARLARAVYALLGR